MKSKRFLWRKIRLTASVAISFILVTLLLQGYRDQRETERRLTELQKELHGAGTSDLSTASSPPKFVLLDGGPTGSETARRQYNLEQILSMGWKLVDLRSPDQAAKAVNMFNEGIANVDPRSPELYNGLGRALLVADRPRDAIAAWRKGLALSPTFSDMQSGIGWGYWNLNDPYRAKESWRQALAMNPHSVDAWSAMAWIDLALGDGEDAKKGFEELVKFDSSKKSWVIGLSMARAHNADTEDISRFFPLPPLESFAQPRVDDSMSAQPLESSIHDGGSRTDSSEEFKQ